MIRSLVKSSLYIARRFFFPSRNRKQALVLVYHSVHPTPGPYTISPEEFEWQLAEIQRAGYTTVSLKMLERMLDEGHIPPKTIALTFDDGREDNYQYAYPLLKKYRTEAAIFLITGSIGSRLPERVANSGAISEPQMQEMRESGLVDFYPHTVSHPYLTRVDRRLVEQEVRVSKEDLEQVLGTDCPYFAYPYGRFNEGIQKIVSECRFRLAFSTLPGAVTHTSDRFALPRNGIDYTVSRTQFRGIIAQGRLR